MAVGERIVTSSSSSLAVPREAAFFLRLCQPARRVRRAVFLTRSL